MISRLSLHLCVCVCVCVCVCLCVYVAAHTQTLREKREREVTQTRKNVVKCSHASDHLAHSGVGFTVTVLCSVVVTRATVKIGGKSDGSLLSYIHHHL